MENHELEIKRLKQEIKNLEDSLVWYKETYEKRSLLGIIKTKLTQHKEPEVKTDLEREIIRYVKQNHKPKKRKYTKKVSIIILSLNRFDDTANAISNIYKFTKVPFEVIILDNNSAADVKENLKQLQSKYHHLKVIFEDRNLGCAGGRDKAKQYATGEYVLFLDNDILVLPYYLENLINRLEEDDKIAGACCKTVFPDGKIQFNGGSIVFDDDYALFSLMNEGLHFSDETSNNKEECQWIPGGTTIWKKAVLDNFSVDPQMKGAFEDNEVCLRLIRSGYKLVNSPGSIVIHNHFMYKAEEYQNKEQHYYKERNNAERILYALLHFYQKHQLIVSFAWKGNPWDIYFGLQGKEEILNFINDKTGIKNEASSINLHTNI